MKDQLPIISIVLAGCCFVFMVLLIFIVVDNKDEIKAAKDEIATNIDEIELVRDLVGGKAYKSSFVTCDSCGLLIWFGRAYTGLGEIRTRKKQIGVGWIVVGDLPTEEYIYYPRYCKTHKPTEE